MSKIIRSTFILINVILVCFTLFSYISPFVDPASIYFFSFFGLLYPFLLILNISFILLWLFVKKRYALISLFTILLGFSYPQSFIQLLSSNEVSSGHEAIKVLSFNAQKIKPIRNTNGSINEEKKDKFMQFVKGVGDVNIFCTQETSSTGFTIFKNELQYPHAIRSEEQGITIFSKNKIIRSGEIELNSDEASAAIWADIEVEGDVLRVYNLHLRSNKISNPAEKMLKNPDIQSSQTWKNLRGIMANYKNSTIERVKQVELIDKHIQASPHKTIICGDLNDTPLSHVYHALASDKKDSFKERGTGIGTTYAGVIPALRIDYILTDDRLDIIDHQIHKGNYSDHYPISAQIVLP